MDQFSDVALRYFSSCSNEERAILHQMFLKGNFPTDGEIIRLNNAAKYYKSAIRSAY